MKFSVIICTYNYAHLLPDTLRTLRAQTIQDFELLVVDDGSTDNTEEVVRRYAPQFRNCIYLKKPHCGPGPIRKLALEAATGTHIAFIDADDLWSPQYLATVRSSFESNPKAEVVFCNGLHVRNSGLVMHAVFPRELPPLEGQVRSPRELLALCVNFCPTGTVFLKSLYDRVGPFDVKYGLGVCEDTDWAVRAVNAGAYCIRLNQKLFLHRYHGGNITTNPKPYLEPWLGLYRDAIRGSPLGPEFERHARRFTRSYALRLLGICSPPEGRALITQTLETLPGDLIMRCAYVSTYLGSIRALKILKWGKRLFKERFPSTRRLDLTAPPEALFEGV